MHPLTESAKDQTGGPLRLAGAHILIMALVVLLLTVDGVDMQILGVTVSAIAEDWGLPLSAFGVAMAAGHLGAAIGASVGGLLADQVGRRPTILLGVMWFGVFTLSILLTQTPEQVAAVRLVAGIGLGGCLPPALALISEALPARLRPLGVSLAILSNPLGIAISGYCSATMLPSQGWQSMYLLFGLLPFAVVILLFLLLPESPAFLARLPREKARQRMVSPQVDSASADQPKAGLGALFRDGRWITTLSIFAAFFCAYISMSMVLSWLPSLLTRGGFSQLVAGTALSAFSLAGMAGIVLAGVLMASLGTRNVALSYIIGAAAVVAALAVGLPTSPTGMQGQFAYFRFYTIIGAAGFALNGTMTCLFAHASATFASTVRATGIGFAATCGRVGAILGAFAGVRVLELLEQSAFFGVVAGALAASFLLLLVGGNLPRRIAPAPAGS